MTRSLPASVGAGTEVPRFAVVGRVNKGKSSIIATLTEDDQIAVSPLPGTTREVREFPFTVDGQLLFVLVDTPGFERAPAALSWLEEIEVPSHEREARVRAFVDTFAMGDQFTEECALLQPVLAGAGILYVVDGEKPYRDNYRAEMEILRWTGRPSMALINRGGQHDHAQDWRRALNQYFKVVRDFDAQLATFDERVRLLTTLRELHEPWRPQIQHALTALLAEAERRRSDAAHVICDLLVDALCFSLQATAEESARPQALEQAFHDGLRRIEDDARARLAQIYHHDRVIFQQAQDLVRPVFGEDLFAARTWATLGLSGPQLLATYTVSGAVTGGLIDAGVGAASFGTGAALGALVGAGLTAWHLKQRFAQAQRVDGVVDGVLDRFRRAASRGPTYRIGPFKHPNFPFILLDRALRYHRALRDRAHALTAAGLTELEPTTQGALGEQLGPAQRRRIAQLAQKIQRRRERVPAEPRAALFREILGLIPESQGPESG